MADRRAPTPSAAAELAVPDTTELKRKISNIITREADVISAAVKYRRDRLSILAKTRAITDPMAFVNDKRMMLDSVYDRIIRAKNTEVQMKKASLGTAAGKLSALNPMAVLSRGYSAVYKDGGVLVKSVDDVKTGDRIEFRTVGGSALCTVDEVKKTTKKKKADK